MDNPARPAAGTALCALDVIAHNSAKGFVFREGSALFAGFVVRDGDQVRGYVDSCPHAGSPLSALPDRYLTRDGKFILCQAHGALFLKADGECVSGPCSGESLTPWPVEISQGVILTA
jgi:nitrite reductase/ring-hydroxylating ferredoxin subunit